MKLTIYGKGLTLTDAIKTYVESKIGRVEKFYDGIVKVDVYLTVKKAKSGENTKVDVLAYLEGSTIKCSQQDSDMYAAIDTTSDVLERQIKKKTEKMINATQSKGKVTKFLNYSIEKGMIGEEDLAEKTTKQNIVQVLLHPKPMSVEEAILQLEALEKIFYAFTNIQTGKMNVVYKRKDGDYGYIDVLNSFS